MSQEYNVLTKSIGRIEGDEQQITVPIVYLLKDEHDRPIGRVNVTIFFDDHQELPMSELRDQAARHADELISRIVSLLPSHHSV